MYDIALRLMSCRVLAQHAAGQELTQVLKHICGQYGTAGGGLGGKKKGGGLGAKGMGGERLQHRTRQSGAQYLAQMAGHEWDSCCPSVICCPCKDI